MGVGHKWIKGFYLIVRPLTLLTHATGESFFFSPAAHKAQQKIKDLITTTPVLVCLDYEKAKLISRHE
jgi:hypothetical protein